MYTQEQAREQIPGLVKKLNHLILKTGSYTMVMYGVAEGYYDIQTKTVDGHIVLIAGAQPPMETWRTLNRLIDFTRQVHGLDRYGELDSE